MGPVDIEIENGPEGERRRERKKRRKRKIDKVREQRENTKKPRESLGEKMKRDRARERKERKKERDNSQPALLEVMIRQTNTHYLYLDMYTCTRKIILSNIKNKEIKKEIEKTQT